MSDLPLGWALASLGDLQTSVGIFSDGDWIESKDQDPEGENRLLQLADIGDGRFINKSSRFVNDVTFERLNCTALKEGDVLIARMPDPLGRACLMPNMPQRCLTVVDVAVFRSGHPDISQRWLMHAINASPIREEISRNASGTTRKRIARGKLSELEFPVPPAAEQKRIAQKLDALLAQVDTLKARIDAIPALLKRFRQSVLADASSGRLTSGWRARHEVTPPQVTWTRAKIKSHAFKIPEQWLGVSLGSVCERVSVGHVGKTSEYYVNADSGVPFLRSQNVRPGRFSLDGLAYITNDFNNKLKKSQLKEGDLLVVRVGANRGDACIVPKMKGPLNCANIVFARPCKGLPPFLNVYFQSPMARSLLLGETVGGAQGVINTKAVSEIFLALPPKEEQTEIVRRVEQLFAFADQLEAKVATAKQRIDTLTQTLLAKAFRGELVPQDPNDEPASVLLERIRAQRAAAPKPKRGRKTSS